MKPAPTGKAQGDWMRYRGKIDLDGLRWGIVSATVVLAAAALAIALDRHQRTGSALAFVTLLALVAMIAALLLTRDLRLARALAVRDPLTGLPNRTLLDDRITQALSRAGRTGERFALLVLDLDGFKEVNDIRGHDAGDQVLRTTARRIESVVRASDTVARIGGDEFVVLSLDTGTEDEAEALVARIRSELHAPYLVEGTTIAVGVTVGWAIFPSDGVTPVELLGRADSEMLARKRTTDESRDLGYVRRPHAGFVREFHEAMEHDEVVVHYQPILDTRNGLVVGAEALVRRVHPERGILTPVEFISHVERTSLVRALTLRVVEDALVQAAAWRAAGHDLRMHVNIPYRLLDDPELGADLETLAALAAVPPSLTLEVAARDVPLDGSFDRRAVGDLRQRGIELALDDFGRGSSLPTLRILPVSEVKIDAAFVRGIGASRIDEAIVDSLARLAAELGHRVTAEGVETREAWDALADLGCARAQGYYIQHPLPADAFAAWLENGWPAAAVAV